MECSCIEYDCLFNLSPDAYSLHSPKQGSVTSESLTLPVPALHVHILGVPPAEMLFVGQEAHTPEEG